MAIPLLNLPAVRYEAPPINWGQLAAALRDYQQGAIEARRSAAMQRAGQMPSPEEGAKYLFAQGYPAEAAAYGMYPINRNNALAEAALKQAQAGLAGANTQHTLALTQPQVALTQAQAGQTQALAGLARMNAQLAQMFGNVYGGQQPVAGFVGPNGSWAGWTGQRINPMLQLQTGQ
jgi:hypothetical protein